MVSALPRTAVSGLSIVLCLILITAIRKIELKFDLSFEPPIDSSCVMPRLPDKQSALQDDMPVYLYVAGMWTILGEQIKANDKSRTRDQVSRLKSWSCCFNDSRRFLVSWIISAARVGLTFS